MRATKKQTGFTIVETLMVLAVTGMLFVSTSLLVQGQITRYQEKDAVLNLESTVRNVLNDVSNGYYPDKGNLSCSLGPPITAKSDPLGVVVGTSSACVYAGKEISFDADQITIKTLATDAKAADFSTAVSKMVPVDGLDEIKTYKWGIAPTTVYQPIYVLYTNYAAQMTGGVFISGAQNVGVFYPTSTTPLVTNGVNYCFANGNNTSSITILPGLQVSSKQKENPASC